MSTILHHRILSALLFSAILTACTGKVTGGGPPAAGQTVTVTVLPADAEVGPGQTLQFTAIVTGTANAAVTWRVEGAGTIDANGLYTAPLTAGDTFIFAETSGTATKAQGRGHVKVKTSQSSVAVAVTPQSASLAASGSLTFVATVTGSTNTAVTWAVQEASGCGAISSAGVFTAPATAGTCHVVARSVADTTRTGTATVTVTAPSPPPGTVAVTIGPSSGAVDACRSLTFQATVTGATDTSVTWTVLEGAAGGVVTSAGVYTAPNIAGTYHVVATSQAAPSSSAVVPVVVTDRILSVGLTPSQAQLAPAGTAQFTATVTTTCGAFTQQQAISAPALTAR